MADPQGEQSRVDMKFLLQFVEQVEGIDDPRGPSC